MDTEKNNRTEKKNNFSNEDVKKDIQKVLSRHGKITEVDYITLKNKYGDEKLIRHMIDESIDNNNNINKKAKKLASLIKEKYNNSTTPYHILLEKAYKYKIKYNLSDSEFAEFQRIYEQELIGLKSTEVVQSQTNLMKVLGNISLDFNGSSNKLNDSEFKYLQEIMKLYATTRPLQAQVLLQSIQYTDCDVTALSGSYDRNLHRVGEHVHPVIAALFLPKFKIIENFFLYSNIAGIMKSRYNGERLHSRPDFEVFYAITTDPNDIVCDNSSPYLDLLNRAQLQTQIWNSVLHLRNGQYYNTSFRDFIVSVDMCRLNKQDSPDLLYGRFDGVVIKRLLSAFSFRPTVVATTPAFMNAVSFNPYAVNIRPVVTSIPMINMRVPPFSTSTTPLKLETAITQVQFFLEGGVIVPKNTNIIWSRGILVFYVDRRATVINYNDQLHRLSMNILPSSVGIAGFERINKTVVLFDDTLTIGKDENYNIRSVVISEVNTNPTNSSTADLVIGSSALIKSLPDPVDGKETYHYYDPYAPIRTISQTSAMKVVAKPIREIYRDGQVPNTPDNANFLKMAYETGNVFIYGAVNNDDDKRMSLF